MSFFDLQTRDIDKQKTRGQQVGPGVYFSQEKKKMRQSYAPFGSLSNKKDRHNLSKNVGPGHYEIKRELVSPSISKYENRNIIIVKIHDDGSHQFKSRSNRFLNSKESEVGPGSYEVSIPGRKAKSTSLQKPKIIEKIKQLNYEYYKKNRQVSLLSDPFQNQKKERSKTEGKDVKTKGVNWGLNKKERFSIDVKQQYTAEEKEKALSEIKANRKKRVQPSAAFASKTIKSHLETQIYKTSNPFKAELRRMINFKDEQPGPGSYELAHKTMTDKTPAMFQFFGSTVQRFPESMDQTVGPGAYKVASQSRQKKDKERYLSWDKPEKEDRYSYFPQNFDNPGPGSYIAQNSVVRQTASSKQFDKSFGSRQPRFSDKKEKQEQIEENFEMTTFYRQKLLKKQEELRLRRAMIAKHENSVFASGSKRFADEKDDVQQLRGYDLSQDDIGTKVSRYKKMAQQLQQCHLHKPAFLSSETRFKMEKGEVNFHKDCWCLVKNVQKQMIEHQSSSFASGEKRKVFPSEPRAPPVGHYQNARGGMIKGSFNSRFRKKAQNHIKKSNVLQNKKAVSSVKHFNTLTGISKKL